MADQGSKNNPLNIYVVHFLHISSNCNKTDKNTTLVNEPGILTEIIYIYFVCSNQSQANTRDVSLDPGVDHISVSVNQ